MATSWISSLFAFIFRSTRSSSPALVDSEEYDHPLLKAHSNDRAYSTSYATYPSIRTFYHPHDHADKLKAIADLPLIVFVHGLGGSLPQFALLLGSFVNLAPVFAIELPGHGQSQFAPTSYGAYTSEAFVELWKTAIEEVCDRNGHRNVVLVCHSMGCSIGASLVSRKSNLTFDVVGMTAICPKATPPTAAQVKTYRRLLNLPDFVLDILRWFDRRGDESSSSVKRFVGETAEIDLKRRQLKFNKQFRTPVWKRTTLGLLPTYDTHGIAHGGLPGEATWKLVKVPLLLIAGESDTVTKPEDAIQIVSFVQGKSATKTKSDDERSSVLPVENESDPLQAKWNGHATESTARQDPKVSDERYGVQPTVVTDTHESASTSTSSNRSIHSSPLKSVVLPKPAAHALMYDHSTYRTVAGLVEDFLSRHVSHCLELGWQLQQLTTSGKWDVKNLEKWKSVAPVSGPIDSGLFRALKTLREQDDQHSPAAFVERWGGGLIKDNEKAESDQTEVDEAEKKKRRNKKIYAVIDISHDSPVYDTKAIERGGVEYHKFPTVSKIPPTVTEVKDFIALVDRIRAKIETEYHLPSSESLSPSDTDIHQDDNDNNDKSQAPAIGVHCHYGYNRTGFFIVCYLIERRGYRVQDAIEEFARAKPPGIRHDHFIDTLYVRYCVGLRRSSTFERLNS